MFKKICGAFAVLLLSLCGCAAKVETASTNNDKIELTLENYRKYIATYIQQEDQIHYWNFYGSTLCKFEDVVVTYTYDKESDIAEGTATYYECELTISGCGQIKGMYLIWDNVKIPTTYNATITAVSGYVEVLF